MGGGQRCYRLYVSETVYVIAPSSNYEGLGIDESCPTIGGNAKVWLGEDGGLGEDKDWEGRVWYR